MFGIWVRNPKHACSLKNVLLCLLKSLCNFRQNSIHMFLIHFPKLITMFFVGPIFKSMTFKSLTHEVTLSCMSWKQGVTFPMRAEDLAFRGNRMCPKTQGTSLLSLLAKTKCRTQGAEMIALEYMQLML